jgi:hypothetical protein
MYWWGILLGKRSGRLKFDLYLRTSQRKFANEWILFFIIFKLSAYWNDWGKNSPNREVFWAKNQKSNQSCYLKSVYCPRARRFTSFIQKKRVLLFSLEAIDKFLYYEVCLLQSILCEKEHLKQCMYF